ncbi:MAG: DUF3187 family protein [Planctomycetota bacterium]|nr:DUF3187 family protein [Planctomycetota bacterium]
MKRVPSFVVLLLSWIACACSALPKLDSEAAARVRGPLLTRHPHPILLTFPHLGLRRAVVQRQGTVGAAASVSYSSIFENVVKQGSDLRIDAELALARVQARVGVAEGVEVALDTGLVHGGNGSLDKFIGDFHQFFGFPNSGRDDAPDDKFDVHVNDNGTEAYSMKPNEVALEDLQLTLGVGESETRTGGWGSLWRATLELPTGKESDGFGNGELDYGLGWCGERDLGRQTLYVAASWIHAGRARNFRDTSYGIPERFALGAALETRLTAAMSVVVQLELLSPISADFPSEELDAPILDLVVGVVHDLDDGARLSLGFQEDVISASGTDFAVIAGLGWGL